MDDYANIVELSTAIDNSSITLMGWFKSTSNGEPNIHLEGIFGFRNYPSYDGNFMALMNWTGWTDIPTIECYGGIPGNIVLTPSDDTWYHLALVFDNTNTVFSTYLDGIQMASNTATNDPIVPSIELLNCNIAGTTFLDLEDIEPDLKKHQLLVLKRDPKNEYDDKAILILTEDGRKLGYVPQEKNEVLSNLMDAGKLLFGRLNEKTWVDDWLKLDIQVYLRDL